ncbi:MAG: caspase family protein [Amylibacter sp.]|nr:caspase family protein [Amylibacter sp.]
MSRKALIVGIDYYDSGSNLYGCVNDAHRVNSSLARNSDGTVNFSVELLTATAQDSMVTKKELKDQVRELFSTKEEVSIFYYSGHGFIDDLGGYLVTSDAGEGDDGLSLNELIAIANKSPAENRIIVLDSCHSGIAGNPKPDDTTTSIGVGVTILTASSQSQYAMEENDEGVFTSLFVDALNGSAANLVGDISPASIYAHIDQSLGPWVQRPVFKTSITSFVSLKKVQPPISLENLHKLTEFFDEIGKEFQLDPSFEPESDNPNEENCNIFAILQKMVAVNLVKPVDRDHMYFAAMDSKSCKLTVLGEHYWKLVDSEMI